MRKLLGVGIVVLGSMGVLLCAAAAGLGWWAATKTADRLDRIVARLTQLARVESRVSSICRDLNSVRGAAETIAAEKPDLPHVQTGIERLLDRLVPTLERADALADSLRSVAAGLRTVMDIVEQFTDESAATVRVRSATDKIDRAAETLRGLRTRVEDSKSAKAVRLARELGALAREALAGSELLAEGLATARDEIVVVRRRTVQWRNKVVYWIYVTATANTLVWLWGGLGQLCLVGWGRRRFAGSYAPPVRKDDETNC